MPKKPKKYRNVNIQIIIKTLSFINKAPNPL